MRDRLDDGKQIVGTVIELVAEQVLKRFGMFSLYVMCGEADQNIEQMQLLLIRPTWVLEMHRNYPEQVSLAADQGRGDNRPNSSLQENIFGRLAGEDRAGLDIFHDDPFGPVHRGRARGAVAACD